MVQYLIHPGGAQYRIVERTEKCVRLQRVGARTIFEEPYDLAMFERLGYKLEERAE